MINKPINVDLNNVMNSFVKTDDILKDMCGIIESSQKAAYQAVNATLVLETGFLDSELPVKKCRGKSELNMGRKS